MSPPMSPDGPSMTPDGPSMSLEERVTRLMEQFVDSRPPMLELISGERDAETPWRPTTRVC